MTAIEPKVMDVLRVLIQTKGEVVAREFIIDRVWGGKRGSDEGLTRAISLLRKAFGSAPQTKDYIQTVPKCGYRLTAAVLHEGDTMGPTVASSLNPKSIAVLPFLDMSEDSNLGFLCDGLSEELINALAQIRQLSVGGRTSSFVFKGVNRDLRHIAQTLNVAYLIEGSIRHSESTLCATVQLIDGHSGYHLFSQTFKGSCDDLFAFQEHIASETRLLVKQSLKLHAPATASIESQRQVNPDSHTYRLFLRGKHLIHQLNGQNTIPSGIDYLQRAIKLQPDYHEAIAWLALGHFILPEFSKTKNWQIHIEQSRVAVDNALRLNTESSLALLVKAMHLNREFKFDAALDTYTRAYRLDPNNVETIAGMGLGLMTIGLHQQAKPYFQQVIESDPLCGLWHTTLGGVLMAEGDFVSAEAAFTRSFKLGFGAAAFGVSSLMADRGMKTQAVEFMCQHYTALGPIEASELRSPIARKIAFAAFLKRSPWAVSIMSSVLKRRLRNKYSQPSAATLIGFLFLNRPGLFLSSIIDKPNPYLGYTLARIWEPTEASKAVRLHVDFPGFVEQTNLVAAWNKYGWPEMIKPGDDGSKTAFVITG